MTRAHSQSYRETAPPPPVISREVLWSAMRPRIAFAETGLNKVVVFRTCAAICITELRVSDRR
jgi:hypothetical protein